MFLVEIFLPLADNHGSDLPQVEFDRIRDLLTERFGGMTAFSRAPAEGYWKKSDAATATDDIIVFEVMTERLEKAWWAALRRDLEARLSQESILIRAHRIEKL